MASLQAVAGSKFYIGSKVAPKDEVVLADFVPQEALWLEVTGWTQSGAVGDTQQMISQDFIDSKRTRQIKGTLVGATMENTFAPRPNDPGQIRLKEATESCSPYAFKIAWGAGCASEGEVEISVGTPGVVTWPEGHGLEVGAPVIFDPVGGNMPTGLSADTVYYVVASGFSPTQFSVAATPGGSAIATTLAATATSIIATAQPAGQTDMFYGLAMPGSKSGGAANSPLLRTTSIAIDSNIIEV